MTRSGVFGAPSGDMPHLSWLRTRSSLALCSLLCGLACAPLGCASDPAADGEDEASVSTGDGGSKPSSSKADAGQGKESRDAAGGPGRADAKTDMTADDDGDDTDDDDDDDGPAREDAGTERDASSGASDPDAPTGQCGEPKLEGSPFGCDFAWGTNDPGSAPPYASSLGFLTKWVGYEVDKSGKIPRCDGCSWLRDRFKSISAVPVYYAYFIGFFGKANGLMDQNENPDGPNLATHASQLIRDHRAELIEMYASYAKQSARAWPEKPLVWLLEGDFVQYTYKEQKGALSMAELAALARDITCAIKSNMPNAVVAINQSTWLADDLTNSFYDALAEANVSYDLVWTTGVANNMGFFEEKATPTIYNQKTARYAYVAEKTGRKLFVDTSFGLSAMGDTWAVATADTLNARIADGVIAANVVMPAADYADRIERYKPMLDNVCK